MKFQDEFCASHKYKKREILLKNYTDNCPAFLTNIAGNYLSESLIRTLENSGYNLTKHESRILFYLYEKDGREQKQLRELIKLSKISLVKIINSLEEKNIVIRIPSENDARNNRIFLTSLGKKLREPLLGLIDEQRSKLFKGFNDEEIEIYIQFVQRLIKNAISDR